MRPITPPPDALSHRRSHYAAPARIFHGWWIVAVCLVAGLIGNALGLFGVGVYIQALVRSHGWPLGLIAWAATLFYVVSAILLIPVGSGINRFGPRPAIATGAVAMACGVAAIGQATAPWQAYLAFLAMGIGWACLSTTALATTLAPWFDKYQGRAVSIASLGASAGGMIGVPVLLFGIERIGPAATTGIAGLLAVSVVLPPAIFVLRHRPADIGLFPDGAPPNQARGSGSVSQWTRRTALRTTALRSVIVCFALGMMVQIGFLTHQVTLLSQSLGLSRVSLTVSATAVAALAGRLGLAHFADQINPRRTAAAALLLAALCLALMALFPAPPVLIGANVMFGLTVGNVTTLQPIIVRREFGAPAFGAVFGVASGAIQLVTALGPGLYGLLHDEFAGYSVPLSLAAALDVLAAAAIIGGGSRLARRDCRARPMPN